MNSTPPEDERLDALLRSPLPPLPDDGFSHQVVSRLTQPQRGARNSSFLRVIVIGSGALAGLTYVMLATPRSGSAIDLTAEIGAAVTQVATPFLDPLVLGALSAALLSLALVFYTEIRHRLVS